MTRLSANDAMTYADVLKALQRDTPSRRLDSVVRLRCRLSNDEWWPLLGLIWYACDSIHKTRRVLTAELRHAPLEDLRMMMSAPSAAAWDALPVEFIVYRGCAEFNRAGLSWSTSREVATAFAYQGHLPDNGAEPLLVIGRAQKRCCVVMLDRGEREVVAWNVLRLHVESLPS